MLKILFRGYRFREKEPGFCFMTKARIQGPRAGDIIKKNKTTCDNIPPQFRRVMETKLLL